MTRPLYHALALLRLVEGMGITLWAEGDHLRYRSAGPLPTGLASTLTNWESELLTVLQDRHHEALCASASPEDAADLRQERAAILEHDPGLPRGVAERQAGVA